MFSGNRGRFSGVVCATTRGRLKKLKQKRFLEKKTLLKEY